MDYILKIDEFLSDYEYLTYDGLDIMTED